MKTAQTIGSSLIVEHVIQVIKRNRDTFHEMLVVISNTNFSEQNGLIFASSMSTTGEQLATY